MAVLIGAHHSFQILDIKASMELAAANAAEIRHTDGDRLPAGHHHSNKWTWAAEVAAVLVAVALMAFAFVFRFDELGGKLGGFSNDEFGTLVHTNMILSGQQPLRDFEEAGLRAAWPSLTFELPAMAQRIWGQNLFVHACLTLGALAFCQFVIFLLARRVSRSGLVAALASVLLFVSMPRPYNYPKILVLTVGGALLVWAVHRPNNARLGVLAAWTTISILFRNDFGVYLAAGIVAGLIAVQPRPWGVPIRRLITVGAVITLLSLPSIWYIHQNRGIVQYISEARESSHSEWETRRVKDWPYIHLDAPAGRDSLIAVSYYTFWFVPVLAVTVLLSRRRVLSASERAVGWGVAATATIVDEFFLRSGLGSRFGDAAVPFVLACAWMFCAADAFESLQSRRLLKSAAVLLLVLPCLTVVSINEIPRRVSSSPLVESLEATEHRFADVREELRALPPVHWSTAPTTGHMAVSRYLSECVKPDEYVLVAMYADDIIAFSLRHYAGGQPYFDGNFFQSDAWQKRALERLAHQSVPVAITDYANDLTSDFPLIAQHLVTHYRQVGTIEPDDEQHAVRVWVDTARQPTRVDPVLGFPCFRESAAD